MKFVDLSGYGFSGKHAAIDLLREFRGYAVPHFTYEFLLLRIQGGIHDLECALVEDWSPIRSDAAVRRFKRLIRRLGTKNSLRHPLSLFEAVGWNYNDVYNGRFLELSETYIDKLVAASWVNDWPFPLADLSGVELFVRKTLRRLGIKRALDFRVYLSSPENFVAATRAYLAAVLTSNVPDQTTATVMHNAFEPFRPERSLKFFDDARCIIVDRDPRDIYVQQLSYRPMAVGAQDFVTRFRLFRRVAEQSRANDRVLRIRFEDLVCKYEQTTATILRHLDEPPDIHERPQTHFRPEVSRKNIGVWRHHPRQSEIDLIQRELREYCVDD